MATLVSYKVNLKTKSAATSDKEERFTLFRGPMHQEDMSHKKYMYLTRAPKYLK